MLINFLYSFHQPKKKFPILFFILILSLIINRKLEPRNYEKEYFKRPDAIGHSINDGLL